MSKLRATSPRSRKPLDVLRRCFLPTMLLLATSCAKEGSESVVVVGPSAAPAPANYSELFQSRLLEEYETIELPPCHPQDGGTHCSAMRAAIIDYGDLRERLRVFRASPP